MPDTVIDSRALDVRIAREVYGKEVRFLLAFEDDEADASSRREMGWYEISEGEKIGREVPLFSTRIEIAQEILEDWPVSIESDGTGKYRWVRSRMNPGENERVIGEWEGDMAMAICHGALEYVKAQTLAEG